MRERELFPPSVASIVRGGEKLMVRESAVRNAVLRRMIRKWADGYGLERRERERATELTGSRRLFKGVSNGAHYFS